MTPFDWGIVPPVPTAPTSCWAIPIKLTLPNIVKEAFFPILQTLSMSFNNTTAFFTTSGRAFAPVASHNFSAFIYFIPFETFLSFFSFVPSVSFCSSVESFETVPNKLSRLSLNTRSSSTTHTNRALPPISISGWFATRKTNCNNFK